MNENGNAVLYTVDGCPRCAVLKKKLIEANIPFDENNSEEDMRAMGIDELPVLYCNGTLMSFGEATAMINSKRGNTN